LGELSAGTVVAGRFVLDRLIGTGGMGMVWAATHSVTHKQVALKMLLPERAGDPALRARFLREARAACAVRHPNIVEIHDVVENDGAPVMVMDLLQGESLGNRLQRLRMLLLDQAARILVPTVNAVGTAHAAGIVHRDLKPDNIFIADQGGFEVVRVLDFGIAKIRTLDGEGALSGALTGTGAMLGTPFYMAPEQLFGERDIDQRADLWAMGVILYECLAGKRPTRAENLGQILRIITSDAIVPLEKIAPELPADVTQLVGRMLQRERSRRPDSMAEVQDVLHRYAPDVLARSLAEPKIVTDRMSRPSFSDVSSERSRPDGSGRLAAVSASGDDVSATAPTLSSTTASTTADRAAVLGKRPRGSGVAVAVAVAVVAAVAASGGVYLATRPSVVPTPPPAMAPAVAPPPAVTDVALPPLEPSASTASSPAPSVSTSAAPPPSRMRPSPAPGPRAAPGPAPSPPAAPTASSRTSAYEHL
jgi:serine/threonine-protein kinase